jgi:FHA domain-containing protein
VITLEVTSVNGAPPTRRMAAEFDELGGTIGRADNSTLVLADPEKVISRTHASVTFRRGAYVIQDRGTAVAVAVNGQLLGNGREAAIEAGDTIQIGAYTLRVAAAAPRPPTPATSPAQAAQRSSVAAKDDPLALFGGGIDAGNPFGDLLGHPVPAATPIPPEFRSPRAGALPQASRPSKDPVDPFAEPHAPPPMHAAPQRSTGGIPDDFDPFGQPASTPGGLGKLPDDIDLSLGVGNRGRDGNINDLFGLAPGGAADPFGPGHPLGDPSVPVSRNAPAQRNDTPEIHAAFQPPVARPDPALAPPETQPSRVPPRPQADNPPPAGMFVSWDAQSGNRDGEVRTVIIPTGAPSGNNPAAFRRRASDADQRAAASRPPAGPQGASRMPPSAQPISAPADTAALLRAFLVGAGVPDLALPGTLTPQLMQVLGQLFREATQGTLDLLVARSIVKREMRAEATIIRTRENNPLKFSPNVEAALSHLLNPQAGGFMSPIRAMRDAYDDLRAHQLAVMTGMEAAFAAVLGRFKPEELEHRLSSKSLFDAVLPMNRKAKLWDLFEERYVEIARELDDDFHASFGKEFLRAYEAQMDKLERENTNQRKG